MDIGVAMVISSESMDVAVLAEKAESLGFDSFWLPEHPIIPVETTSKYGGTPDGSIPPFMMNMADPFISLARASAVTRKIKLGTSVLILPYRPPLPTAKAIATIQELSGGRLLLGVGIGWMEAEFKALGVPRQQRGRIADDTLSFIHECFANDEVKSNEQALLFRPRPERPPIYIGGAAPHAIDRALKFGDGWIPMGRIDKLKPQIEEYIQRAAEAGLPAPEVMTFFALDPKDEAKSADLLAEYEAVGITRVIVGQPYETAADWMPAIEMIATITPP